MSAAAGRRRNAGAPSPLPGLSLSFLAIRFELRGTVLETELNSENKSSLPRRDPQGAVGEVGEGPR